MSKPTDGSRHYREMALMAELVNGKLIKAVGVSNTGCNKRNPCKGELRSDDIQPF